MKTHETAARPATEAVVYQRGVRRSEASWRRGMARLSRLVPALVALGTPLVPGLVSSAAAQVAQPWRAAYTGNDALGKHVLGHWSFDGDDPTADSGPLKLSGKLDGAQATKAGKFGGAIESFPGYPKSDKHHALVVAAHPSLSPPGAFTAEMWVQAKPELAESSTAYLLDKKYASHNDFQWLLDPPDKSAARRMVVNLGFGGDSETFATEPLAFRAGQWHHVAFTYDGAGTVRFYRDGSVVGVTSRPGRRGITAGANPLCIGDRVGSSYGGFPGVIDEVRLCTGSLEFGAATVRLESDRTVFVRGEKSPVVRAIVRNLQPTPLRGASLEMRGFGGAAEKVSLPDIPPGEAHTVSRDFDTQLRPDDYACRAVLSLPGDPPAQLLDGRQLTIVPRPLPHRMPVVMWGIGGAAFTSELPRLESLGFTACFGIDADTASVWAAKKPVAPNEADFQKTIARLDTALSRDFGIVAQMQPGYFLKARADLRRVDREGKPYARHDCNASLPGLAEFSENVGKSVGQAYGQHPAFVAALVNSEVRDDSEISFSPFDREAYRSFAGTDIPDRAVTKLGVLWREIQDFPADRVVADDHPLLKFYRWFWTVGDGWNGLHTALHKGLKSAARDGIWTWYDPVIRVPSIGGSGGEVDVLSQWTYTEQSPQRVGYFCDEVFAMAAASPQSPRVMKMTQLFWYRSSSAPIKTGAEHVRSPFDDHDPDAAYISISPMHLRGAFWAMVSRPVAGLMYHGWSSLVPTDGLHPYKYTQPDLQTEFRRLHHDVLPRLGPALLQVGDRRSDVAYLDSFTSQVFARRGSFGYSHDEAYLTLLHAQLQPEVIFEETLLAKGLDGYKVLVLVDCDVLPQSVATKIVAFQKRGGIVIGDPNLAPAIKPDIVLPRFARAKKAAEDEATILANAAALRTALDKKYSRYVEGSNPEILSRVRSAGEGDYVFVMNDKRTFGTYVGQHGLVMEEGLPSDGQVRIDRADVHVYDLVNERKVAAVEKKGRTRWPVALGPCEGGLFLVTPRPVEQVLIEAPEKARRGGSLAIEVRVADGSGEAVPSVIPLSIEILDPSGRRAEFSGTYGAAGGRLSIKADIACNDATGVWQIRAREGATGLSAARYVEVQGEP
jgi:hypothetical protein